MFLPNGTHIYFKNPTIEGLERLRGMIERPDDHLHVDRYRWHRDDARALAP